MLDLSVGCRTFARVAGQDVELADDAAVLELEDRVRQHPAPAGELAGDRRGGALLVGDGVLDRGHDAGARRSARASL